MSGPPAYYTSPPPKIQAAMQYLSFCEMIRGGGSGGIGCEGWKRDSRDLTSKEQRVYEAALDTILLYFKGEGFGEPKQHPESGDDPNSPVRQPA